MGKYDNLEQPQPVLGAANPNAPLKDLTEQRNALLKGTTKYFTLDRIVEEWPNDDETPDPYPLLGLDMKYVDGPDRVLVIVDGKPEDEYLEEHGEDLYRAWWPEVFTSGGPDKDATYTRLTLEEVRREVREHVLPRYWFAQVAFGFEPGYVVQWDDEEVLLVAPDAGMTSLQDAVDEAADYVVENHPQHMALITEEEWASGDFGTPEEPHGVSFLGNAGTAFSSDWIQYRVIRGDQVPDNQKPVNLDDETWQGILSGDDEELGWLHQKPIT